MEVVLALGVFAGGVLVLFGLLSPLTGAVTERATQAQAERAGQGALIFLSEKNWVDAVLPRLVASSDVATLPLADNRTLFVSRDSDRVGTEADAVDWGLPREGHGSFFEVTLIRNDAGLLVTDPASAGFALLLMEISWPVCDAAGEPIARFLRHRLIISCSLRR